MFRYPVVVIRWLDAHAQDQAVQFAESEVDQIHRAEPVITIGLLIKEDAQGVTIYNEETGPDSVRGLSFVPRPMIESVERYKLVKVVPRKKKSPKPPPSIPEVEP